ncbi:MAG: cytochrome c oxidase assembly protein [Gammaproteobacteria bacterium]|nr:cytochrome c oxidase assembly protein [Gammaproteobacteria bacterium]
MQTRMHHTPDASEPRWLVAKLSLIVVAMFGFGYLLVPIYDVFCELTGLNGKTATTAAMAAETASDRVVSVEFVASVNENAPWVFRPNVSKMQVQPGKFYDTTFYAQNRTDAPLLGHAVPSVAPGQAARHFQKTECFCFTEQEFEPQEGRDMPVRFILDPDLPEHIATVTLSYTFFAEQRVADSGDAR